jgi:hypothetical protein
MTRRLSVLGLLAALGGFGTGCQFLFPLPLDTEARASEPSRALRVVGPSYGESERLEAEVLIDGVLAGKGMLETGKRCLSGGKAALPVRATASTAGIVAVFGNASATSAGLIDLDTNAPLEGTWSFDVGDVEARFDMTFKGASYRMREERHQEGKPDKPPRFRPVTLPTEQALHDAHTILGYLRSWDAPEGARGHLYMTMGKILYRVDAVVVGAESVPTARGPVAARRIDGVATRVNDRTLKPSNASARTFSIWVSDDEERIPQRVLVETKGITFALELARHEKGEAFADGAALSPCEPAADHALLDKAEADHQRARAEAKAKAKSKSQPKPQAQPGAATKGASAKTTADASDASGEPADDDDDRGELIERLQLRLPPRRVVRPGADAGSGERANPPAKAAPSTP